MIAIDRVSKANEASGPIWRGVLSPERLRKAVTDAILTELGLTYVAPEQLTVSLHSMFVDLEVPFSVVQDGHPYASRADADADRAAWQDSVTR